MMPSRFEIGGMAFVDDPLIFGNSDGMWEVRYVLPEDVEAYKMLGWTADHDALKDTNHGIYSVLMWREIE